MYFNNNKIQHKHVLSCTKL